MLRSNPIYQYNKVTVDSSQQLKKLVGLGQINIKSAPGSFSRISTDSTASTTSASQEQAKQIAESRPSGTDLSRREDPDIVIDIDLKDDNDHVSRLPREISQEKGRDKIGPVTDNEIVVNSVKEILGGTIMDLRNIHRQRQNQYAAEKDSFDSDSDSENDLEDTMRQLAIEDTTWFQGCGFKLTIDTAIAFTQIIVALIMSGFCIVKLMSSDDCSVTGIYVPILTALLTYFLPSPISSLNALNSAKDKFKKN